MTNIVVCLKTKGSLQLPSHWLVPHSILGGISYLTPALLSLNTFFSALTFLTAVAIPHLQKMLCCKVRQRAQ